MSDSETTPVNETKTPNKYYITQKKLIEMGFSQEKIINTIENKTLEEINENIAAHEKQLKLLKYVKSRIINKAKQQQIVKISKRGRPRNDEKAEIDEKIKQINTQTKVRGRREKIVKE